MKNLKLKINIIDLSVLLIVVIMVAIFFVAPFIVKKDEGSNILVTIRAKNATSIDYPVKPEEYGEAFLNSQQTSAKIVKIEKEKIPGTVDIQISGKGTITDKGVIFQGSRITIGRKADIHSKYFARGIITEAVYDNK